MNKINSIACTGSAKISDKLHIHLADKGFYGFINDERIESLRDIVIEEDIIQIEQALRRLSEESETQASFRMVCVPETIKWVSAKFVKDEKEMYGTTMYTMCFLDLSEISDYVEMLNDRIDTMASYVDLMNAILITYSPDKNELKVFSTEKSPAYLFTGTLESFKTEYMKRLDVCESHSAVMEELISNFENTVEKFSLGIKMKFSDTDGDYDWCEIYGKTITDKDGNKNVIAKLEIKDSAGNAKTDVSTVSNTRDFGTGLVNKATIVAYGKGLIASKPNHSVAIAIIDLDNFKIINDTYGHKFGDEVLLKSARIVQDAVGDKGMAGRIGGDEMMIICEDVDKDAELRGILRTIRTNIEWSYKGIKDELEISCSIGAVMYPTGGDTYERLFEVADKMLYLAKEKGRNRYIIYVPELHHQYVEGVGQSVVREIDRVQYNKTGIVCELIGKISSGIDILSDNTLERINRSLDLEDISFISATTRMRTGGFGYYEPYKGEHVYLDEEGYQDLFDDNNMCVFNTSTFVDRWSKTAHDYMKDEKISATIQYRHIIDGEVKGYISFNKRKFSKKWTEMDISLINIIANILGYYLFK